MISAVFHVLLIRVIARVFNNPDFLLPSIELSINLLDHKWKSRDEELNSANL